MERAIVKIEEELKDQVDYFKREEKLVEAQRIEQRTLYDIEKTLADIKSRTSHLKNLKIGIMGCIVNGPGEMADADYGYVGAAAGKVSLYKNKDCVEKNIPAEEAIPRLIALIKESGDWVDAE